MEQYRIFAYDPCRDIGACFRVADVEGYSEADAMERYKARNSAARDADDAEVKFFARSYREKERWPDIQTGRLSKDDLRALRIRGEITPQQAEGL